MTKKSDAEVVREVTARIDATIAENRRTERIIVAVLLALFGVGLTLIVWGAAISRLELLVPGGLAQLTIAYPVRRLIKLREDNVRLQIIPQLLRLAEIDQAKDFAAKLIERLSIRCNMGDRTKKTLQEVLGILKDAGWMDDHSIHVGGNVVNSQVGQSLTNSSNMIQTQPPGNRRDWLEQLQGLAKQMMNELPEDKKGEAAENLEMLVKQATSEKPNRRWYSASAEGLLEAARLAKDFSGNIAGTITNLGKAIWPDSGISGS